MGMSTIAVVLRAIAIRIRKSTWKSHNCLTALTLAMLSFYLIDVFIGIGKTKCHSRVDANNID
ncbi:uncharacterized protein BO97DRAFT_426578 [Aspergillus homomorphus CBS 101889]|uniref:Uncharacterized protein n=1 Tax=Aspergillus homomorphus (strain CBS 101889) TaxID=1450537 RepID=A0A395HQU8_ASPHC|nr:hypothetical protein BO97DRAFT_426578 [Aspergillus homomorphus CBS 101889]RAL10321.1 hypothetical protein BO97DRAFT_426578 [Aspergillus homomorphus CBS 101889]